MILRTFRSVLAPCLFLSSVVAWGQTGNACDLNLDGKVDAADVQAAINMSLGTSACTAKVAGLNACNIVVVQRVVNASLTGKCSTSAGLHVVALSWQTSAAPNVTGYKVYRGAAANGPFTLLQALGNVTAYTDNTVLSGQTYYYVVTALDSSSAESPFSSSAQAVVPVP